jgi:hypothetical protein
MLDGPGDVCIFLGMDNIKAEFRSAVIAIIDGLFNPELSHVVKHVSYNLSSEFESLLCLDWQASEVEKIWEDVM